MADPDGVITRVMSLQFQQKSSEKELTFYFSVGGNKYRYYSLFYDTGFMWHLLFGEEDDDEKHFSNKLILVGGLYTNLSPHPCEFLEIKSHTIEQGFQTKKGWGPLFTDQIIKRVHFV